MHSKREPEQPQRELFEIDLEQLIDMSHPLVGLGHFIDWHSFEHSLGQHLSSQSCPPGIWTRLMVALHYLKYQHSISVLVNRTLSIVFMRLCTRNDSQG
jgi:hypothetical protein